MSTKIASYRPLAPSLPPTLAHHTFRPVVRSADKNLRYRQGYSFIGSERTVFQGFVRTEAASRAHRGAGGFRSLSETSETGIGGASRGLAASRNSRSVTVAKSTNDYAISRSVTIPAPKRSSACCPIVRWRRIFPVWQHRSISSLMPGWTVKNQASLSHKLQRAGMNPRTCRPQGVRPCCCTGPGDRVSWSGNGRSRW